MEHAAQVLAGAAHTLAARATETASSSNGTASSTSSASTSDRPASFKIIGIALAVSSGAFIGTSFVLKKMGLLKANEKYNEVAGEGYGYLKNVFWWSGMTLMIVGEICNFVAYAFTDAILVTPLGALSVVITTVLSAIFLKERLSMVGKVACFLCIVGSVVIVMNAPQESSVATIQEMQHFVLTPGFLSFAGVVLLGSAATAFWAGPRYGKKNMLVYLSICSWVGGLSVVATQGLGSAIVAQASGKPQFNQWFLYVLLVFVIGTLLTEIVYLNKALNLFNAAMVTPTYYVYFTSTTIITSAVLFQGFKGSVTSIVTVVNGFLTICSGVVLLQLSKSAKDVPDTAVFAGDLDQIQTIAEQEQPETEPKADAIRGAAAIVRRLSTARQNMEVAELKRLHEEKMRERLEAVNEDAAAEGGGGGAPVQYEWDGIRRRRTVLGSQWSRSHTASPGAAGAAAASTLRPFTPGGPPSAATPVVHPPLGWSHVPTEEELAALDRHSSSGVLSRIAGTIRGRARGRSLLLPTHNQDADGSRHHHDDALTQTVQSPMHPVQLTEIAVPTKDADGGRGGGGGDDGPDPGPYYSGYAASDAASSLAPPDPPPHSARRQFSFQNVFRRHQQHGGEAGPAADHHAHLPMLSAARGFTTPAVKGATEEERLGLVKGDSRSGPALTPYYEDEPFEDDDDGAGSSLVGADSRVTTARYGRGITGPARPRLGSTGEKGRPGEGRDGDGDGDDDDDHDHDDNDRPPRPPSHRASRRNSGDGGGSSGAFI